MSFLQAGLNLAAQNICLITLVDFDVLAPRDTLLIRLLFLLGHARLQLVHLTDKFLHLREIAGPYRLVHLVLLLICGILCRVFATWLFE